MPEDRTDQSLTDARPIHCILQIEVPRDVSGGDVLRVVWDARRRLHELPGVTTWFSADSADESRSMLAILDEEDEPEPVSDGLPCGRDSAEDIERWIAESSL